MDPFRRELHELRREMDRMFSRFFSDRPSLEPTAAVWAPTLDLSETEDHLVVRAEVPGLSPTDIQVSIVSNTLSIKGEKKQEEEKEENFYRMERRYGFSRSISLSCEIDQDKVDATYKDGILIIKMPKSETAKGKEIKIDVKSQV